MPIVFLKYFRNFIKNEGFEMTETVVEHLEKAKLSRFHYGLLLLGCLIYGFTAMNVLLIGAVLTPIRREFQLDLVTTGLMLSTGYAGMFVGAFTCGVLADIIGRKKTLLFTISTMTTFTALNSLAPNVLAMGFLRFLAGIGLGGSLPQPGVYVSEYIPAKYRGRFLGLVEASWVWGALSSLAFPFFLIPAYGWRPTFLVALIPIFLIPIVAFLAPESLRFLQLKGRTDEAINLLRKYQLVPKDFSGIAFSTQSTQKRFELFTSLKQLWSPTYWRRTALLWVSWAVLVYTYHGIFIWLPDTYSRPPLSFDVVKSLFWVFIVTLAQVPGYYSAALLLDSVGRKKVFIVYLMMAGIGSLLLGLARDINSILFFSMTISFFNLGAWSALYTYTPELYPTGVRGTGSGAAASIGRVAGIIAPTATPLLYTYGGLAAAFTIFALAHFFGAITVVLLGTETKGKALEEISKE